MSAKAGIHKRLSAISRLGNFEVFMKPTRLHYFYAYKWPVWIWMIFVSIVGAVLMASALGSPPSSSEPGFRSYVELVGLGAFLGLAVGALAGKIILGPIYVYRAKLNGAPFRAGEQVRILVGANRGRVVRVLESWDWRGMVRVDLGERARSRRTFFGSKDIFDQTQLLRIGDAEQPDSADAEQRRC